ncbi:MAG: NAD(P)/FAD-dependent oxidoreductase [Eubacterium sp.]
MKNIAVIGGGAAGLTAAISAAKCGAAVTIFEHGSRVGKKILSTGNGKCNLTNMVITDSCYRASLPEFPLKVIMNFDQQDTMNFFKELGLSLKEKNGYIYPSSLQASSVLDMLMYSCEELKVMIIFETHITISKKSDVFIVKSDNDTFYFDSVIIATGGKSAPGTGSDGSGYKIAKSFNHNIIKPLPALTALKSDDKLFKSMSGVRISSTITLYVNKKSIYKDKGEIQLTDYGISGIPVFNASHFAARALDEGNNVFVLLDLFPEKEFDALMELIIHKALLHPDMNAHNLLNGIINKKVADVILKKSNIKFTTTAKDFNTYMFETVVRNIKEFNVNIIGTNDFNNSQVTCGGIDVSEINPNTLESLITPNLYFAGEILDVDGICGGYNLQFAWSSGYIAGENAAK